MAIIRSNAFTIVATLLAASNGTIHAYSTSKPSTTPTRRDAFTQIAKFGLVATAASIGLPITAQAAIEACPPKSNNCVRTSWTPPSGTSKSDAIAALKDVINAYPQEGQNEVDGGGWTIAEDNLAGESAAARVEYRSSGKGTFAKLFNGGKPFVDDLKLEVEESGVVQVRSQSRVGDSDFGVNGKVSRCLSCSFFQFQVLTKMNVNA